MRTAAILSTLLVALGCQDTPANNWEDRVTLKSALIAQEPKALIVYHDKLLASLDDDKRTLEQLRANGWLTDQEAKAITFKHTTSDRKDLFIDKTQIERLPALILYTNRLGYWTFYDRPQLVPGSNRRIDHRWGIPKRLE